MSPAHCRDLQAVVVSHHWHDVYTWSVLTRGGSPACMFVSSQQPVILPALNTIRYDFSYTQHSIHSACWATPVNVNTLMCTTCMFTWSLVDELSVGSLLVLFSSRTDWRRKDFFSMLCLNVETLGLLLEGRGLYLLFRACEGSEETLSESEHAASLSCLRWACLRLANNLGTD